MGAATLDVRAFADAQIARISTTVNQPGAFATVDAGGRFVVKTFDGSAPRPGVYRVTVAKYRVKDVYNPAENAFLARSGGKTHAELFPNRPEPTVVSVLPERYARPETSGLTLVLPDGGAQNLKIELTSRAQ